MNNAALELSPATAPRWTRIRGGARLGVVMIVKDEAHNLPFLFSDLREIADEVVVVDTGSTDKTAEICRAWGVKLVHEPWRDDFAFARNRSIEEATAQHLLWLDGDDRLPAASQKTLIKLRDRVLPTSRQHAYIVRVENTDAAGRVTDNLLQARIFPRIPEARFRYAVHEQITDSLIAAGVQFERLDCVVHHCGYADAEAVQQKVRRNEELLRRELEQQPDSVHHLAHLAQTCAGGRDFVQADAWMSEAIQKAGEQEWLPTIRAEYHMLRSIYRRLRSHRAGMIYDLEQAISLWPEWGVPYSALAERRMQEEDWDAAWELVEQGRSKSFAPGIHGFRLARAQSNLAAFGARILRRRGQTEEAAQWMAEAVALDPDHLEARLELGDLLLDAQEFGRAREVLEPAGADPAALPHFIDVSTAIALARVGTGDVAAAQGCLAPLLDLLASQLAGAEDVGPMEMASALLRAGHPRAARRMVTLFERSLNMAA